MLTPTISSPTQVLHKLERELWRAFHHQNRTHKADHFYNFCITAQALRDHFFEAKNLHTSVARKPYHDTWSGVPELAAADEIANTTKHAALRERKTQALKSPRTRAVRPSTSEVVTILQNAKGELKAVPNPHAPSITVVDESGRRFELYEFMDAVVKYWQSFLRGEGFRVRRQQGRTLYGGA